VPGINKFRNDAPPDPWIDLGETYGQKKIPTWSTPKENEPPGQASACAQEQLAEHILREKNPDF